MKAGIVDCEKTSIAKKRRGKHVVVVANDHATTEEFLEACFLSCPYRGYIRRTNWRRVRISPS
jgi:hypothetical protein